MLWSIAIVPIFVGAGLLAAGSRPRLWLGAMACTAMGLEIGLVVFAVAEGWTGRLGWSETLVLTAKLTPVSAAMALLVPVIALPVLAYASAHEHRPGLTRLIVLLLIFVGGMELLVIADDLLTLLVGWELVGACSWALIGHEWRDAANPRSGQYAFLMTRFGDLGMFVAAMAAFAGAGSFAFDNLTSLPAPYLQVVAFGLLLSAASKSGQVPFAPWLFRAMAGPTSVSALLHAATMVAAGAYLLIRLAPTLSNAEGFSTALIAVGLATALSGGLVAVLQPHFKKLLAASTSAHFGLMFVAVGTGFPGVALLHLIAHAAFKALLFLVAGVAGERAGTYALDRMGFGRVLPITGWLSAIGALALAGLPPLGGGWTKEAIVSAAEHRGAWVAAGVMLAGALTAAYATRFQLLAYGLGKKPPSGFKPSPAELGGMAWLAALSLLLSLLWLPSVQDGVAWLLNLEMPTSSASTFVVSWLLVTLGLFSGMFLARRHPELGTSGVPAGAADWLGLPSLIDAAVTGPFVRLASSAAWFDDVVIDAIPRAVQRTAFYTAEIFTRADRRVVDRGVEAATALAAWLAKIGDQIGEAIADGLPEGSALLAGLAGSDARRIQTGLSHHYYAILMGGAALAIVALILAS